MCRCWRSWNARANMPECKLCMAFRRRRSGRRGTSGRSDEIVLRRTTLRSVWSPMDLSHRCGSVSVPRDEKGLSATRVGR